MQCCTAKLETWTHNAGGDVNFESMQGKVMF